MSIATPVELMTVEAYLAFEKEATSKYEYYNGKIIEMPGGTALHNEIAANVITALKIAVRTLKKKYRVYTSDMKIHIESANHFVYPDAVVVAEEPQFFDDRKDIIINPLLIVEILSEGTAAYDRGPKFQKYQTLPSFQEYVLVSQDRQYITTYFREEKDLWRLTNVQDTQTTISLKSLNCTLALADIYESVEFGE
jgi:Uma2 family endonuclease